MKLERVHLKNKSRARVAFLCPRRDHSPLKVWQKAGLLLGLLALPLTLLTSCKSTDADDCVKKFDVTITPDKIDDGTVYISPEKLNFLFEADYFIIDDTDLKVAITGRRSDSRDIDLDLNGIKLTRDDGHRGIEHEDFDRGHACTNIHFKPHKLHLNGAEDFSHFMSRVKTNRGKIAIRLHGGDDLRNRYKSVQIELIGRTFSDANCKAKPAPTPTPTPVVNLGDYAPKITATNPNVTPTNSTNMMVTFSATATDGVFFCSLDNAVATKCSSPVNYSNLTNGTHLFQVSGQTPGGVSAGSAASYSWAIDTTAPTVTITNAASLPTLTNNTAISLVFSATKPSSTFTCSLDSATASSCTSPAAYNSLTAGLHSFQVWATDSLGNISPTPALFQWNIDLTAPVTSILNTIPTAAITNINTMQVTFSANKTANFACSIDNGPMTSCTSPASFQNLAAGNHYFGVIATDLAGNVGLAVTYAWITDYTAPVITLGSVVPAQGLTNAQSVSAAFSADKPAAFTCTFDNLAPTACVSPFTTAISASGPHTLVLVAADLAGNISAPVTLNWQMDFTAPIISFGLITPNTNANVNSTDFTFQILPSKSVTLNATLNGVSIVTPTNPITLSGLAEGSYTLTVSATDLVGYTSNVLTYSFTVDLTAPILTLSTNTVSPTNKDVATFTFTANESATFACNFDGAGFAACVSPAPYAGIADGSHTFIVQATDLAGNASTASFSWIVDTVPPTTTGTISVQTANATVSLGSNKSPVTFTCSIDNGPLTVCSQVVSYTNLESGPHLFVAYSTDASGNIDPNGFSTIFYILPPIQTIISSTLPAKNLTNSTTMIISFTATVTASAFECSLDSAPATSCSSPVTYTGLVNGAHNFLVKATDQSGHKDPVGAAFTWTVDTAPPAVSAVSFSITSNTVTITYTTNKLSTDQVLYGAGSTAANINQATTESTAYSTTHTVTISGLTANTAYTLEVAGHDQAGNAYASSPAQTVRTHR